MTEDEAKKKLCHKVRGMWPHPDGNCVGSDCMAWLWLPLMADDAFKNAVIKAAVDIGDTTENKHKAAKYVTMNRAEYGLPIVPFDGYCGLVGKP